MDYFRVSKFNGLTGPMYGVEHTRNDGESWTTTSVHSTPEAADREMRGYVALHRDECQLWEGSLAQKIFDARVLAAEASQQDQRCIDAPGRE